VVLAPQLAADSVAQDLAQVRVQSVIRVRLELLDLPDRRGQDVLHQVLGIEERPGPLRNLAARPAPQNRTKAGI